MCCHSHEARRPVVQGNIEFIESNQVTKIPVLVLLSLLCGDHGDAEWSWNIRGQAHHEKEIVELSILAGSPSKG